MKRLLKFAVILLTAGLTAGLIFSFAGCGGDSDDTGDTVTVSYENFAVPSIFVENLTGERLVAFKGSLNPNYLISGIPAYSGQHGLKKDPALFTANGDFVLLLITEDQYKKNKKNLGALSNQVFARVYAFYNHSATNNNVFKISSKIGGDGRLTISNPTAFNVEIRKDGPTGEILGYAAANMTSGNIIYLNAPESYDIYPVFKFFNPSDKELYSVTPKYTDGVLIGKPYMVTYGFGGTQLTHTFNLRDIEDQGKFNLTSGSIYFRVNNNSYTGIRFQNGSEPVITSIGIEVINSNSSEVFVLRLTPNPDGSFPEGREFGQLRIGTTQNMILVPSQYYELDYTYEVYVTGLTASNLVVGAVDKRQKVDLDKLFGLGN